MITPRGYFVFGILTGLVIAGLWWLSGHLWWTGEGYCIGSMLECVKP